jgi:NAD(P)-dependent dehydrogenase (short-subunit alcohol dehydrogenase family)
LSAAATVLDAFRLDGKAAIVTGASSGLGVAFARGLAEVGADVAICGRREHRLAETREIVESAGGRCHVVPADVTSPEDCQRVVDEAFGAFGRVDVLVNNAGIGWGMPATREAPEEFRRVHEVNLHGTYWMAQSCARVMRPGSSIVNLGSVLGSTTAGLPQAAYCSSKAAIIGLTRDLAQEWTGRKGIRVNALAPGFFPTEMTELFPAGYLDTIVERVPAGRLGRLEEIVSAMIFLASDAGSYVSGVVLPVDGGLLTS